MNHCHGTCVYSVYYVYFSILYYVYFSDLCYQDVLNTTNVCIVDSISTTPAKPVSGGFNDQEFIEKPIKTGSIHYVLDKEGA